MTSILSDLADKVPGWVLILLSFTLGGGAAALIQALRDVAMRALELAHEDEEEPRRALRPIEVLHDSDQMWQILHRLREEVGAERVLLCRQENGGKLPTVGRPLTISIDLECVADDLRPVKMEWQGQLIDAPLTKLLLRTYNEGGVEVTAESAEGIFRGSLKAINSPTTHLFPVFSTEGIFYYLTVNFRPDQAKSLDDALYRDRVRVAVAGLVSVFGRWYEGVSR